MKQSKWSWKYRVVGLSFFLGCQAAIAPRAGAQIPLENFSKHPPGKQAVPFMPDFFEREGQGHRFGTAISDDGKELYFAVAFNDRGRFREEIRVARYVDNHWTKSEPLLDESIHKYVDPHFSPDGQRLYFIYTRPLEKSRKRAPFDIWYVNRSGDRWSEPINVGSPVSAPEADDYYVSLTAEKTIYFGSNRGDAGNFELYRSTLGADGKYRAPEVLLGEVNTKHYEADVFVAQDESYLIFSSSGRKDGAGDGDLYVSFRGEDGAWGAGINWGSGINMGSGINSSGNDFAPSVSRDGKFLFYSRGGVIHWCDSKVIQDLRGSSH
ncbi:MAG: hypothetical protein AAGG44_14195 [Planctomycetota bacterium]